MWKRAYAGTLTPPPVISASTICCKLEPGGACTNTHTKRLLLSSLRAGTALSRNAPC